MFKYNFEAGVLQGIISSYQIEDYSSPLFLLASRLYNSAPNHSVTGITKSRCSTVPGYPGPKGHGVPGNPGPKGPRMVPHSIDEIVNNQCLLDALVISHLFKNPLCPLNKLVKNKGTNARYYIHNFYNTYIDLQTFGLNPEDLDQMADRPEWRGVIKSLINVSSRFEDCKMIPSLIVSILKDGNLRCDIPISIVHQILYANFPDIVIPPESELVELFTEWYTPKFNNIIKCDPCQTSKVDTISKKLSEKLPNFKEDWSTEDFIIWIKTNFPKEFVDIKKSTIELFRNNSMTPTTFKIACQDESIINLLCNEIMTIPSENGKPPNNLKIRLMLKTIEQKLCSHK